ncbi:MAG: Rubredoxin [Firmicutes bacterium ADurb.Bin248]|jgi:rubredoxin|nr:MAG: Rubredoxin [Firmicutes bacterium ADurb.Bin248]HOG01601.1 rubredoxin [Clostridia bacterium]HPK15961.1 rubredoxin [Clostridia bacterium]
MRQYVCSVCGYVYDEAKGIPEAGIAPGTKWEDLGEDWVCPICGAAKSEFNLKEEPQAKTTEPKGEINPPAAPEGELRALSALETSALCSNLARGCEKQYKPAEAEAFRRLAEYFKGKAEPARDAEFGALLRRIDEDLSSGFPGANAACAADRGALRALVWSEKVTRIHKSLLARYEKEGEAMLANTGVYVCTICGFLYIGDNPPDLCPVCKVPGWKFERIEGR